MARKDRTTRSRLFSTSIGALALVVAGAGCRNGGEPEAVEALPSALTVALTGVALGTPAPSPAGSYSVSGTTHTLKGAGTDIWNTADQGHFAYQTVSGDCTITARVVSLVNTQAFAKAGVMMRETLAQGSKNAFALVTPDNANGFRLQVRTATDATSATPSKTGAIVSPYWVRLIRTGNSIKGQWSNNGSTFSDIGTAATQTVTMGSSIQVGLATTSHLAGTLTTAVFDNVTITTPAPPAPPPPPTNVTPTPGDGQVGLSWTASTGATSYDVKWGTTSGSYTDTRNVTTTSTTVSPLSNGTPYFFVVVAKNANGQTSSVEVSATPVAPPRPMPPTNVVATPGDGQVTVSWTAPAGPVTSYDVRYGTASGEYTLSKNGVTTTSTIVSPLTNGTPYYFVVVAINNGGISDPSGEATATPVPPPPPPVPTGLVATAGNGQVTLTWNPASGATSYDVKRGTTSGSYTIIYNVTATSLVVTPLVNGTPYFFVVAARNSGGPSGNSTQASATPQASWSSKDIGAVNATGSFSQSGGTYTVKGAGADIYGTADAFRYAYQTISGDVTIVARVQSLTNTNVWAKAALMIRQNDTAGSPNVAAVVSPTAANKYRLQVRATAGGGSSSLSSAGNSVIPSWLKLERTGDVFKGYSSTDGSNWTIINTTTLTLPASVLVGLAVTSHVSGTTGTLATGVFTNVSMILPPAPQAPAGLAAQGQNKQVHLSWSRSTNATSYTLLRSDVSGGPYTVVQSGLTEPSYTDTGRINGNTYYYVAMAANPGGESGFSVEVPATPQLLQPSVVNVSPLDGATNVSTTAFLSADPNLPNSGGGIDSATLTGASVSLKKTADGSLVPATLNTSGAGDVIVVHPNSALEPNTGYTFTVTAGLLDLTGAPFIPFTSSFTTGDPPPPPPPGDHVRFDKITLSGVTPREFTSITIGPDNKLYVTSVTGEIQRYTINADGTIGGQTTINTIRASNGNADRAVIGLTFDPTSTASNLILWVTHGAAALKQAPDWSGKLSKLTGANLSTYQDVVVNFPRSYKDHMTNSIAFKPGEAGVLYINQGSMSSMGGPPDSGWDNREEHVLSAAVLRLDTSKLGALPLNVQTNDLDPTLSGYNPFAANAPLTLFATGIRNAYDLIWHSNGQLYVPTNGSGGNGSSPGTTSPLPSACNRRIDGTPYTGPTVQAVESDVVADEDFLFRPVQGGYYGHPNQHRCEWVRNGGNPTSGTDLSEEPRYSVGTLPDRNWRGYAHNFGLHESPDGVIEWKNTTVFPEMAGNLLVARYSGSSDIVRLVIDPVTKDVKTPLSEGQKTVPGAGAMADPLDLVAHPTTGNIYVTDHAAQTIILLRPNPLP